VKKIRNDGIKGSERNSGGSERSERNEGEVKKK
jgi:hypothetical protein